LASTSSKKLSLPDKLGDGWQAAGPAQTFSGEKAKRLEQGEVGLEYGLQSGVSRSYAKGKERLSVELFEMHFPSGAYGFYTFNRRTRRSANSSFVRGVMSSGCAARN
jgi:hypothetical protein